MTNIDYIVGDENTLNTPLAVFDDEVCEFLETVSKEILSSSHCRLYPDLAAFAFICRKANLKHEKDQIQNIKKRIGRGLCFHIAPSNIPINFAFSYIFSLLAGNANIVRLPSKIYPQAQILCDLIKKHLENFPKIAKRTAFVRYAKDSNASMEFSSIADARMIWGGDETIKALKKYETKVRCLDITFPDRYSIAIIDADAINKATDTEIKRLAENFYNDTYLMDQNACSSPQLILWEHDNKDAREKFWNAVFDVVHTKYILQDAVAVDKYTKLCEESIIDADLKSITTKENLLYRAELKQLSKDVVSKRGFGGWFFEYSLQNQQELFDIVTEKFQTVSYFGINPDEIITKIIENNLRGIDRVVPIGKALDIGFVWDGNSLVETLSKLITK